MAKKSIRFIIFLACVSPVLFFLNTGFSTDSPLMTYQTLGFCLAISTIFVWPKVRKYLFFLSGLLIILMSVIFIFGRIGLAEAFGSSAFGLILVILLSYLKQFVKKGYVEKI